MQGCGLKHRISEFCAITQIINPALTLIREELPLLIVMSAAYVTASIYCSLAGRSNVYYWHTNLVYHILAAYAFVQIPYVGNHVIQYNQELTVKYDRYSEQHWPPDYIIESTH